MTTADVLSVLAERGLRVGLDADGRPVLRGPRTAATPALLRVVQLHRDGLAAEALAAGDLSPARVIGAAATDWPHPGQRREYLYSDGRTRLEAAEEYGRPVDMTAEWYRYADEKRWTPTRFGRAAA